MTIHSGFQTFDFRQPFEIPKSIAFTTGEEALKWLERLRSQHPELMSRFRELLAQHSWDSEIHRLTDHQTIERLVPALTKQVTFDPNGQALTPKRTFDLYLSQAPPFQPFKDDNVGYKAHFEARLHVVFEQFEIVVPKKSKELWIEIGDPSGS